MKNLIKYSFSTLAVAALSLTIFSGCGKKDDNAASKDSMNASNAVSNAMNAVTGNKTANAQPAGPAIKSTTLANFLPDISGYTKGNPEHVDMNMSGMSWSSAKSEYTNGDSHVTINIFDYNHQTGLSAAYGMYTAGNLNIETDEEVTRSQQINGFPGWINWKKKANSGSVGVIVNDRIFVVIEANKANSIDDLISMAQKVDLSGIAKAS